jgi:hypothetical protein
MKAGDLVMVKTSWQWLQSNPWMKDVSTFDNRIGIVINPCTKTRPDKIPISCSVLWHDGKFYKYFRRRRLKVLDESR